MVSIPSYKKRVFGGIRSAVNDHPNWNLPEFELANRIWEKLYFENLRLKESVLISMKELNINNGWNKSIWKRIKIDLGFKFCECHYKTEK